MEGERKQVTVLFADLKGSMELLAERDPEEARQLLDPVLEHMMEAVHRYEGTVNQVMGDGIMALFGAPLAHEDHAVRACFAALQMQETVKRYAEGIFRSQGVKVQIRVGLNSGEVVVRSIGSDLHMDYTAVGQTTHLAARMEQIAAPGSIRLAANTLRLVEGYVKVKALGPAPVKGLTDPVEVFELVGAGQARTRVQAELLRGLTRYVGHGAEVEHLRRVLSKAGAGSGQVVAIVGEAGVGKSRLTYEFTHSQEVQKWLILEAASSSFGKATSYLPVIDLLKGYFKIEARDDHRELRAKVLKRVLDLDRALEPLMFPLLFLLDVPVEDSAWQTLAPAQRRQRTLDAVKHLLLREAQVQPLLLVFEDLHWIDRETQALLDILVESVGSARIMLLVNYRPEYQHHWASKAAYSQLRLDSLPAESTAELLAALLGSDPGLAPLTKMLVKRGNPFFLEETVRTLVETGALAGERGAYQLTRPVDTLQVPATVQTILAGRIDRLPAEEKQLLQAASVIGKDVPIALLAAIAEQPDDVLKRGLGHLQAAEFLYETGHYPDVQFAFKHALTHEVTYRGLLLQRRRVLHGRVVEAIETLHPNRLGEQIERLAHHAVQGDLREKSVSYLRQAGLKAAARSALPGARAWFEQALRVVDTFPDSQTKLERAFDIRLDLRSVLVQLGEVRRALERLREAENFAKRLIDDPRLGRVYAIMSNIHTLLGELEEAIASGTRALEIAERFGDLRLRIIATSNLVQVHNFRGEHKLAVALATDNISALPADLIHENFGMGAPPSVYDRSQMILGLAALGRFADAAEPGTQAIRLASMTQHAYTVGLIQHAVGTVHLLRGDWKQARRHFEEAMMVVRAGQVALMLPFLLVALALVLARLGEAREALARLREGEQLLARQADGGIVIFLGMLYAQLGEAALVLGQLDEAQCLGERALAETSHQPGFSARALHLLGHIATHPDRFDAERGEAHYRKALTLAEPCGMRPVVAHCHLGLAKLYRRTGKYQQAQENLTTATAMYREMGMAYWLEQAAVEVRQLA
jgi:class 3 adenylate cyclase/tetratricopeptide (TPR) repeat protein